MKRALLVAALLFLSTVQAWTITEVFIFDGVNNPPINWVGLLPTLPYYFFAPNHLYNGIYPFARLIGYPLLFAPTRFYGIGVQTYPNHSTGYLQIDRSATCVNGHMRVPVDAADFALAPASPNATGAVLDVDPAELGQGSAWTCHA